METMQKKKKENEKVPCVEGLIMLPVHTSFSTNLNLGKLRVEKHFSNPFNCESLQEKYEGA